MFPFYVLDQVIVTQYVFAHADGFTACAAGGCSLTSERELGHANYLAAAGGASTAASTADAVREMCEPMCTVLL